MDTLTHSLVGCAVSDSYFRKRLGPLATPFALAASALPDIDLFTYLISPESAWTQHRGITHSILPLILISPALGLLGHQLSRREGRFSDWTLLALICLLGHLFFDLLTSWGAMPFLPFSNARISWDIVPILDVFLTSAAGLSFVLNRALRWEQVDTFLNPLMYPVVHRHPARQRIGDRVATIAVALLALYLLVGVQQNFQTTRIVRKELSGQGLEAAEVRALPVLFTYIAYYAVARDAEGTVHSGVYSSYAPRPIEFARYPAGTGPLAAAAAESDMGRLFAWFTQGMLAAREEETGDGRRVTFEDRRFFSLARPEQSRFEMRFDFDSAGVLQSTSARQLRFGDTDIREELARLWNLTWRGSLENAVPENPPRTADTGVDTAP